MASENVVPMPNLPEGTIFQQSVCEHHGAFEQRVMRVLGRDIKSPCPECSRIRAEADAERARHNQAVERMLSLEKKLGAAAIPPRFANKSFDQYVPSNPKQERILSRCKDFAENFEGHFDAGRCMLLLGKPGTGKTHLSVSIANYLNENTRHTAVYRTVGAVLQSIRATFDRTSEQSEAQVLAALLKPSLLVLDEIGVTKEKPSDFELSTLFAIINGRYEQLLPTIIVSNLKADELSGAIGERCVDRLREGGGIAMAFDWESQRGKEGF